MPGHKPAIPINNEFGLGFGLCRSHHHHHLPQPLSQFIKEEMKLNLLPPPIKFWKVDEE
jgi:hypothetical protein